jgi:hypothetical protein
LRQKGFNFQRIFLQYVHKFKDHYRDFTSPQVIRGYLEDHSTVDDGKQLGPAALKPRKWTARKVFVAENRDRISDLCDQLAGTSDRQNKDWIPQYQRAVNQLFEELSEDEAELLRQTAVEWNQHGPTEQVQKQ